MTALEMLWRIWEELNTSLLYETIYQLDAIKYSFVFYQLDMFRAYTASSATRHQYTHSPRLTPNYTKVAAYVKKL